jgi:UPF0271 protein
MIRLCKKFNVAIGAHPGYPDKENFGRIDLLDKSISINDLTRIINEQLQLIQKVCTEEGVSLHHVKLHGALYNRAAKDRAVSDVVCKSIQAFDARLLLYGLSGTQMQAAAAAIKVPFANEVFADRTYQDDGSLTPRTECGALIENEEDAIQQVLHMVKEKGVRSLSGKFIPIQADTICLHGDGKHAVSFAKEIKSALVREGFKIAALSF